jgi:hypothetical protein
MFKSPKSKSGKTCFVVTALTLVFALLVSVSCETGMEEEPVAIATFPLESGGIIYGGWTPIKIGFNTPMAEADAAYLADTVKVRDHNYLPTAGTVTWEDNAVYFQPAEKWKTGEKYTCSINGTFSTQDGRVAVIKTELVFYTVSDKDAEADPPPTPEIEEAVFLKKNKDGGYDECDYDADEYQNNIIEGECGLKIRFDEDMDFSEPKKNLRMDPYRKYDVKVIDSRTLAVYFESGLNPVKKITFTVLADTHSLLGEELKQDYVFTFTEWKDDLQISAILILETAEYYENDCEIPLDKLKDTRFQAGAEKYAGERIVEFTYQFDIQLDLAAAMESLSKIKLIPDDDRITQSPFLLEVMLFSPDYDQTWAGMDFGELNDPYRYLLVIPGGIDGIAGGNGHYLKEDITIMLDVVDWDEIDPANN